jgi:TetR/AcrR family transcriptional regulator
MRPAGAYHLRAARLAHDMLLDAARDELSEKPWAEISMLQIANRAGLGRTRLYQQFTSRAGLENALITREASVLLDRIEQALGENKQNPTDALTATYDVLIAAITERSPVVELLRQEVQYRQPHATRARALLETASSALAKSLRDTWPTLEQADTQLTAESLLRLAGSQLISEGAQNLNGAGVARVLGPHLEQAVAARTPQIAHTLGLRALTPPEATARA